MEGFPSFFIDFANMFDDTLVFSLADHAGTLKPTISEI